MIPQIHGCFDDFQSFPMDISDQAGNASEHRLTIQFTAELQSGVDLQRFARVAQKDIMPVYQPDSIHNIEVCGKLHNHTPMITHVQ